MRSIVVAMLNYVRAEEKKSPQKWRKKNRDGVHKQRKNFVVLSEMEKQ